MPKKYNIGSKADMRRLERDLTKSVNDAARQAAITKRYTIECPHCGGTITVLPGKSVCPLCGKPVDLELKFNF